MGRCRDFGSVISAGCDHVMQAGAASCTCPGCGTECRGLFNGCSEVWARGPQPVAQPVARRAAPVTRPATVTPSATPAADADVEKPAQKRKAGPRHVDEKSFEAAARSAADAARSSLEAEAAAMADALKQSLRDQAQQLLGDATATGELLRASLQKTAGEVADRYRELEEQIEAQRPRLEQAPGAVTPGAARAVPPRPEAAALARTVADEVAMATRRQQADLAAAREEIVEVRIAAESAGREVREAISELNVSLADQSGELLRHIAAQDRAVSRQNLMLVDLADARDRHDAWQYKQSDSVPRLVTEAVEAAMAPFRTELAESRAELQLLRVDTEKLVSELRTAVAEVSAARSPTAQRLEVELADRQRALDDARARLRQSESWRAELAELLPRLVSEAIPAAVGEHLAARERQLADVQSVIDQLTGGGRVDIGPRVEFGPGLVANGKAAGGARPDPDEVPGEAAATTSRSDPAVAARLPAAKPMRPNGKIRPREGTWRETLDRRQQSLSDLLAGPGPSELD